MTNLFCQQKQLVDQRGDVSQIQVIKLTQNLLQNKAQLLQGQGHITEHGRKVNDRLRGPPATNVEYQAWCAGTSLKIVT
jgi:hypothetical protein